MNYSPVFTLFRKLKIPMSEFTQWTLVFVPIFFIVCNYLPDNNLVSLFKYIVPVVPFISFLIDILVRNFTLPKKNDLVAVEQFLCTTCNTREYGIEPESNKIKCSNCKKDMDIANVFFERYKDVLKNKYEWRKISPPENDYIKEILNKFPNAKSSSHEKLNLPLIDDIFDDIVNYKVGDNSIMMFRYLQSNGLTQPVLTEQFKRDQDNDPDSYLAKAFKLIQKTINDGYFLRTGMFKLVYAYQEAFPNGKYRDLVNKVII